MPLNIIRTLIDAILKVNINYLNFLVGANLSGVF